MENPARYTRCAYYEDGNELYVNLYIAGTCKWHAKKLTLSVEGLYPYSDKLRITVSGNASAAINLRAPSWLNSEMTVRVGNDTYSSHGGEYITVNRAWHDGDTIDITIPMSIHLYHSRSDEEIAFMYGPIVLGGDLGSTEADNKVKEYISNETVIDSVASDVPYITSDELDPDKLVTAISTDKLHFRLNQSCTSSNTDVDLFPFHELHHRFYSVYWGLNADSDKYEIELNRITIDKAEPDGQQDELGHALRSVGSDCGSVTVGKHMYYIRSVDENEGSYFEYTLKAVPNKDVFIYVRFYKGSSDTFNVSVNGHKLTALRSRTDDTDICDSFYRVPSEYVNGDSISVSFSAAAPDPGAVVQIRTTSSSI